MPSSPFTDLLNWYSLFLNMLNSPLNPTLLLSTLYPSRLRLIAHSHPHIEQRLTSEILSASVAQKQVLPAVLISATTLPYFQYFKRQIWMELLKVLHFFEADNFVMMIVIQAKIHFHLTNNLQIKTFSQGQSKPYFLFSLWLEICCLLLKCC